MTYLNAYVYAHSTPDGRLFYIGKGTGKRMFSSKRRNPYWRNVVKLYGGFSVSVVADKLTNEEALNFERKIIAALRKDKKTKLVNLTDGGEGIVNPSEEVRAKLRAAKVGKKLSPEHIEKIRQANLNREYKKGYKLNLTNESREARRNMARNQVWTEERKLKIALSKEGKRHSEETKDKISKTKKGVPWSEARRLAQQKKGCK